MALSGRRVWTLRANAVTAAEHGFEDGLPNGEQVGIGLHLERVNLRSWQAPLRSKTGSSANRADAIAFLPC